MSAEKLDRLSILLADEDESELRRLEKEVEGLGHDVMAHAIGVREVGELVDSNQPDVALVMVHEDHAYALDLVGEAVRNGACPIIILLSGDEDPEFTAAAAERGVFACVRPDDPRAVQDAIEVAVRRHADQADLDDEIVRLGSALERRALIERAKGILMERHGIESKEAFELLRGQARQNNRRVVDLAASVVEGHALLPKGD